MTTPAEAPAPTTARARARAGLTAEIKVAARRQMAETGAAALSLRAVSRELGMVSSALYRYFPSRDALLTALIVESFDAVGAAAEQALPPAGRGVEKRWVAVATAIRRWALGQPHDYALVYGSPVPGYEAPTDTVDPAARVSLVALGIVGDGVAAGEIGTAAPAGLRMPRPLHADMARLRDQVAPGVPDEVLARALLAWATVFGSISYELFGHLHGVVDDYDAYFDHQMRRTARLILGPT